MALYGAGATPFIGAEGGSHGPDGLIELPGGTPDLSGCMPPDPLYGRLDRIRLHTPLNRARGLRHSHQHTIGTSPNVYFQTLMSEY